MAGFYSQKLWGIIFLTLQPCAGGPGVGLGLLAPKFLSTTCGRGTSLFRVCTPPTSLDGCGFFNSIVVKLPFSLISDSSERWLCYILVVILVWLCKEVSVSANAAILTGSPVL